MNTGSCACGQPGCQFCDPGVWTSARPESIGQAHRIIIQQQAEIGQLRALLKERDGGGHDTDCKALRGRGCNCGHDAVEAALRGEADQ